LFAGLQLWVDWRGFSKLDADMDTRQREEVWRSRGPVGYVVTAFSSALGDIYGGGTCFQTFWGGGGSGGVYGWQDTPIVVGSPGWNSSFWQAVKLGCWTVLALSLISGFRMFLRLRRVFQAGRRRHAVSLGVSDPLLSALVLYTAFYLVLWMVTFNGMDAQGRNWYPCVLPVFWVGAIYAPKAFRSPALRTVISTGLLVVLLLYSLVLVPFGERAVRRRFYGNASGFLPVSPTLPSRVTLGGSRVMTGGFRQ